MFANATANFCCVSDVTKVTRSTTTTIVVMFVHFVDWYAEIISVEIGCSLLTVKGGLQAGLYSDLVGRYLLILLTAKVIGSLVRVRVIDLDFFVTRNSPASCLSVRPS